MTRLPPFPRRGSTWLLFLGLGACGPAADAQTAGKPDAGAAQPAEGDRPALVRVVPVATREVRRELETTAYLEAERHVTILPRVAGTVTEVLVDEGVHVTRGQVLARIDEREAEALKQQAEARVTDAEVKADLAQLELEASANRVEQARIERDKAKAEYERQVAMDEQLVAKKVLEDAGFAYRSAVQALSVAEFNERKAKLDLAAARNTIVETKARLAEVAVRLADHAIVAPFDGLVVERRIKGGETIGTGTELFVLADVSNLISYVSRPQIQLPLVTDAKEVVFTTDAHGAREFHADIDVISGVVDQATGHFKLRMRVRPEGRDLLRPGMFIRARILTEDARQALMVPKAAVLAEAEQQIVFAERDGQARRVVLDPGLEEQEWVECKNRGDGGLRDGDRVIVSGHEDLADGAKVEVFREN